MAAVKSLTLDEWLQTDNSADVLHNFAVVNARYAGVLAEVLNLQKEVVSEISKRMEQITNVVNKLRSIQLDGTADNSKGPLAATKEEALTILRQMKAFGVDRIDEKIKAQEGSATPISVEKIWIDSNVQILNGINESLSNKSSQEQLRLQTFTSRYSSATEQSSSVIQKNFQSKNVAANNIRS